MDLSTFKQTLSLPERWLAGTANKTTTGICGIFNDGSLALTSVQDSITPASSDRTYYTSDFGKTYTLGLTCSRMERAGPYMMGFPAAKLVTSQGVSIDIQGLPYDIVDGIVFGVQVINNSFVRFTLISKRWTHPDNSNPSLVNQNITVYAVSYNSSGYFAVELATIRSKTDSGVSQFLWNNVGHSDTEGYCSIGDILYTVSRCVWRDDGTYTWDSYASRSYTMGYIYNNYGSGSQSSLRSPKPITSYCKGYFFSQAAVYNSNLEMLVFEDFPSSTGMRTYDNYLYSQSVRDCTSHVTVTNGYVLRKNSRGITFSAANGDYAITPGDTTVRKVASASRPRYSGSAPQAVICDIGNGQFLDSGEVRTFLELPGVYHDLYAGYYFSSAKYLPPPRYTPYLLEQLYFAMTTNITIPSKLHCHTTRGTFTLRKWNETSFSNLSEYYQESNGGPVLRPTFHAYDSTGECRFFSTIIKSDYAGIAYDVRPFIYYLYGVYS